MEIETKNYIRQAVDSVLLDIDLMKSIFSNSIWFEESIKEQIRIFLKSDYYRSMLNEEMNEILVDSFYNALIKRNKFIYVVDRFVGANIVEFAVDRLWHIEMVQFNKPSAKVMIDRYKEEIGKLYLNYSFYVDLDYLEEFLCEKV
uniref:hypothetical protein n=1 Tax=Streptococcus pluranimalium TaxID=82348 RepID=UPI003F6924F0